MEEGTRVIDGTGKYLMPGLWDMHIHLSGIGESALSLLVANGVTGVRDMGGDPAEIFTLRDAIQEGKMIGPRIYAAGPFLETPAFIERMIARGVAESVDKTRIPVATVDEAEAAVLRLKESGADFIKYRTVANREVLEAMVNAAHGADLKLVGHAQQPLEVIVESGQDSLEHFPRELLNNRSEKERHVLWSKMASNGSVAVPTLINVTNYLNVPIEEVEAFVHGDGGASNSTRKYVTPEMLERWDEQLVDRKESRAQNWDRLLPANLRNLREMHEAGVSILPGTDTPVVMQVPGFAVHQELQALTEHVGITPLEMLVNATRECAEFMGVGDELGTVEVGKLADLVLLDANPLDDIANTMKIHGVFAHGDYFDRDELGGMLEAVAN